MEVVTNRNTYSRAKTLKRPGKSETQLINTRRSWQLRRIRMKSVGGFTTELQWRKILKQQCYRCVMCGRRFCKSRPPTKDHIIPVSRGGDHSYENIQALCKSCNSSKNNTIDFTNLVSWGIYSEKKISEVRYGDVMLETPYRWAGKNDICGVLSTKMKRKHESVYMIRNIIEGNND